MATHDLDDNLHQPYDQFILFGDSITQQACSQTPGFGFFSALQDGGRDQPRLFVCYLGPYCLSQANRVRGYTTAHAVKVFPKFFPTPQTATVRFLAIFFGANDASVPGNDQSIPIDDYKKNLTAIIQHPATRAQNPRIILITPGPINQYQLEHFDASKNLRHPSRTASLAKLYAEATKDLGASLDVPVIDLWSVFMASTDWKEGQPLPGSRDLPNDERLERLLSDGLHFTPDGYKVLYDAVMQTIRTKWPEEDPDKLPMVYPGWMEAPQ